MKNFEIGYEHPRLWSALHQHGTKSTNTVLCLDSLMAMFARTIDGQTGLSFNSFMPNVFFHPCHLDESISNFRVVGWYFPCLFKI